MLECSSCRKAIVLGSRVCPYCGANVHNQPGDGGDFETGVRELLARGAKMEAIKLYRERTGSTLVVAKRAVEAMEAEQAAQNLASVTGEGWQAEIVELLRAGKKLDAIKRYKERTGASLMDSKEAVESIAARQGIASSKSGCLLGAVLALLGQT
jgi:ribosomal protein L7/L12